jgi:hypothetical protein
MNRYWKRVAICAVFLTSLAFVSQAKAVVDITGIYPFTTTLAGWAETGTFLQQDKLYTYLGSTNLDPTMPVTFNFTTLGGIEYHTLKLADSVNNFTLQNPPATYQLVYSIAVDPAFPQQVINYVSVGVDGTNLPAVTVSKKLYDSANNLITTLTNTGGVFVDANLANYTYLKVIEDISIAPGGQISSTTDTYRQGTVPEPASIVLWSLMAGVGIVYGIKRRKKSA